MNRHTTKVTLLSCTALIIPTIYCVWQASRKVDFNMTPKQVLDLMTKEAEQQSLGDLPVPGPFEAEVRDTFRQVIDMRIPLAEMIDFVFLLDFVPITLREQLVRHRIGTKFGERLGADIVPDIQDSSWWSQTMRVMDMSKFASEGRYALPEFPNFEAEEIYHSAMKYAETCYQQLLETGMAPEDARNVVPLGANHSITWKLNMSALMHVVGKRGCWIAQMGIWKPLILGLIEELATKVDPYFRELVRPPCVGAKGFTGCLFCKENIDRISGEVAMPPCPLYLAGHRKDAMEFAINNKAVWTPVMSIHDSMVWRSTACNEAAMAKQKMIYQGLWGRDYAATPKA